MSNDKIDFVDLSAQGPNSFHVIGIGGAGMSAIATVLNRMGKQVSGSDLKDSHVTERLRSQNIEVHVPHSVEAIDSTVDLVVKSTAVGDDNIEVKRAKELNVAVLTRAQMLKSICATQKSIGIAGSHGKTTTTSMVTQIARRAGLNPSFMIGGDVNEIGTNASFYEGSYLIVEADESDRTFLYLPLVAGVITNIENDHLESYNDKFEDLQKSFFEYGRQVQGPLVVCVDEPNARKVATQLKDLREVITVGQQDATWTYKIASQSRGGILAIVKNTESSEELELELAVPGEHNIRNAICAFALMESLGVEANDCIKGLATFGGVARRFQFRGETNGITFVDDYAHLPTEVKVTIQAAKHGEFSKIIALFQPHRYSRTEALYEEFAQALEAADIVIVCEVYSAGELPRPGVTSGLIKDSLEKLDHKNAYNPKHINEVIELVEQFAQTGDLVLTMGAGDITMYSDLIQNDLKGKDSFSLSTQE